MLRQAWQAVRARLTGAPVGRGSVVVIYSKPDCHLCAIAREDLHKLQRKWQFELRVVDIAQEEKLLAEFGERIPLVWVNGRLACKYKIDAKALRNKLRMRDL